MLLDFEMIADKLGVSVVAVRKRSKQMSPYFSKAIKTGGRPRNYYVPEVLSVFRKTTSDEIARNNELSPDSETRRKERSDKGSLRAKEYEKYGVSEHQIEEIISKTRQIYLAQGRRNYILAATREAVAEIVGERGDWEVFEKLVWSIYSKQIVRKDKYGNGAAINEQWDLQWRELHQVGGFNNELPTNRWDEIALYVDAGLAGPGFGAGLYWVIDGTQLNIWVDKNGKKRLLNYLAIMDGLTGMPLYLRLLDDGEKISEVASTLLECAQLHGAPRFGIILDNGASFKSAEIRRLISSFYTTAELNWLAENKLRKTIFNGQTEPYIYPKAKIPRFLGKAKLERTFGGHDDFATRWYPVSYQGSTELKKLSYELGTVPTRALRFAPNADDVWRDFLCWTYLDLINRTQTGKLNWLRRRKIKPTLLEAWKYFGGRFGIKDEQIAFGPPQINAIPDNIEQVAWREYALTEKKQRHYVGAGYGSLQLVDNGISYNFVSDQIDASLYNQKLCVVVDAERRKGYCFKEYDEKRYDARTPRPGDVWFIGELNDHTIRSIDDLGKKQATTAIRSKVHSAARATDVIIDNKPPDTQLIDYAIEQITAKQQPQHLDKKEKEAESYDEYDILGDEPDDDIINLLDF